MTSRKIVHVVSDAAGELADRLHFLRLPQCGLGLVAALDLGGDAFLEDIVKSAQDGLRHPFAW